MLEQIKARFGEGEEIIAAVQPDEKGYRSSSNLKVLLLAIVPAFMIWTFVSRATSVTVEGLPEGVMNVTTQFAMRFAIRIILFCIPFGIVLLILFLVKGNLGSKAKQIYYVFTNRGVFFNQGSEIRYISYPQVRQFVLRTHKSGGCADMLILEKGSEIEPVTLKAVPNGSEILAKLEPYLGSAAYGVEEFMTNYECEDNTEAKRTVRRRSASRSYGSFAGRGQADDANQQASQASTQYDDMY